MRLRESLRRASPGLGAALLVLAASSIFAATAVAAVPSSTAAPTISGTAREGQTLTASNGSWSGSPTSFSYQWQRCNIDGTGCADISAATKQTYVLVTADVDHRVRVQVTATNADGHATASSAPTEVVSSATGPTDSTKPTITGTAALGDELTAHPGTWTGGATSFAYQWLRCVSGLTCTSVTGATGTTYGVRSADVGMHLRVVVRASTSSGAHGWATSDPTATVTGTTTLTTTTSSTTTVIQTTTLPGHRAPTIAFLSLKRSGARVFIRFKVCASRPGHLTIVERDNKARALSFTRKFRVTVAACGTFAFHWTPAARFRTHGRYVVTLRAIDSSGFLSRLVSRSLFF
jgi:hypothetical protein